MKIATALAVIILASTAGAFAQMTVCQGDVCTEENNGVKRKLAAEEVTKIQRGNARTAIGNIQCRYASDPVSCDKKLGELFALFPY